MTFTVALAGTATSNWMLWLSSFVKGRVFFSIFQFTPR